MKKILVLFIGLFSATFLAIGQTTVVGTVLDEMGLGAIGAYVEVEGSTIGTATDLDGNFELTVPEGTKFITISYLGYKTEKVTVKPTVKVTLTPETHQIEEVVVTGMVKQDKRLFTGATTKVEADKAKLDGMADVSRSLEGRAAGVSVQNVSGTFGTAPKIRVRGATSIYGASKPLWVVDGVVLEDAVELGADDLSSGDATTLIASAISGINADDIESFQILKDGSATSIYGARAMAGVIVVTTKKGQAGKSKLSYTGEFTYRMKPSYADYNICNSQEQMGIYQELRDKGWLEASALNTAKNSGIYGRMYQLIKTYNPATGSYMLQNTEAAMNDYLREGEYRNTNWFGELFNDNIMMNHSLSFSTGTEKAQVYSSLSVMYDPGWYKASSVQRYTGNIKANFNVLPAESKQKLTIGINTSGSYRQQQAPGTANRSTDAVTGAVSREFDINPFSFSMNTSRALDPKAQYRRNYCDFNIFDELALNTIDIAVTDLKFQGEINYKPIKGLEVALLGALRYQHNVMEQNIQDNSNQARAYRAGVDAATENDLIRDANSYLYTDPDVPGSLPEPVIPEGGIYERNDISLLSYDFRGTISYNRGFANDGSEGDDHIISLFGGAELNNTDHKSTGFDGYGYQYDNGGIPYYYYKIFKQGQEEGTNYYSRVLTCTRNLAFFGMATYSYKGRYTINGTIRYEGTNKLGKSRQARWLPTWNVSGAWNAHEERWWNQTFGSAWTNASLKASYSLTADRGPSSVTNSQAMFYAYQPWRMLASVTETGIQLYDLENSELTYEKKNEFNIGTALGFVDNRINFEFDYYTRNNFDLIGQVQTQGVGGVLTKAANDAQLKSSGVEFSLSTVNITRKNFLWTSDLIFSHTKNKITKLDAFTQILDMVNGYGRLEGYPIGAMFSIPFAGLTEEGLPTFYRDAERKETYNPTNYSEINFQEFAQDNLDKMKYEGSIDPSIFGSFNNTFTIKKDLRIGIFLTYSFGNVLRLNSICNVYASDYSDLTASMKEMKNRWMVPGDEAITSLPTIASKRQYETIGGLSYAYSAYNYCDQRIAKGDFIRLKEIYVEYNFPKKWFDGQKVVSSFSAKMSGTNLALLYADKKLNGQDPEYYNTGGVSSPIPRQFTLTFRLGL